jgi:4-aminobutyrate aminotransferase/(S)-3-amino-2-methylpropionate transaminase
LLKKKKKTIPLKKQKKKKKKKSTPNSAPGCPDLSILSFGRAFHGRTLSLLSLTHSKSIHKLDIPAFPWPWAPIPDVRYPADTPEHRAWMKTEEDRCIAEAERLIDERESTSPVAGMIIEPIQAEGGDIQAAHSYYRRLRKLASERDIGFIVDEVQTGVHATGTLWAHEAWQLEKHGLDPPDMVTFAKKMQACGVFVRDDFLPDAPYRIYNTWMGDPVRVVLGISVLETAADLGYAQRVRDAGKVLADGFRAIADGPGAGIVTSVRGRGTFLAFDLPDTPTRDRFNAECLKQGLLTGPCGDRSIRVRPMLCFTPALAEQVVDGFAKVAAQLAAEK